LGRIHVKGKIDEEKVNYRSMILDFDNEQKSQP
jgi:hypothetical protein